MSTQQMEDERKAWALACEGFEQIEQNLAARIDILESTIVVARGYLACGQPEMAKVVLGGSSEAGTSTTALPLRRLLGPSNTMRN